MDLIPLHKLSNEFKFPIATFHHAAEAYLVPDILKQTYGMIISFIDFVAMYRTWTRESASHRLVCYKQQVVVVSFSECGKI